MKKFIASLVAVAMIFAIGSTVWADNSVTDGDVPAASPTTDASATVGAETTATVDPDATPTPYELYFDFNDGLEGWYGSFEDSGHKHVTEGGIGNSGAMSVSYGTSEAEGANNGVHSGYYDLVDLVPGNTYEVTGKVKIEKVNTVGDARMFVSVLYCFYDAEKKEWSYKALSDPSIAIFTDKSAALPGEGDETYKDVFFEFIAPKMDEGYDQLDKEKYPPYKFDILFMGSSIFEFYLDDLRLRDVTATSSFGKATPTPEATPTPTATPTVTPTATATVTPVPEPVLVVKIKFKKRKVTIKKGKKKVLKVTLKNAKKAKFSVDKKGKKIVKLSKKKAKSVTVKGKKKGKATVTAKVGKKKATCKVTVKK